MLASFLAQHDPANPALITTGGQMITYRELRHAAHRATCALREVGATAGRILAVAIADPAEALVAMLGVLETGATLMPVDMRGHEAARRELLERARPMAVITEATLAGEVAMDLSDAPRFLPFDAALLIFTSGSSGEPKGVLLSPEAVLANIEGILGYLPVRQHPRTALLLPLSYSYALVGQAMVTLRAGGTLLPLQDVGYPALQLEAMVRHGASGLSSVPTSLRLLAQVALDSGDLPPLGYVASAGSALDAATRELVRAAFPGARLFNQYGLTEACPRVTAVAAEDPAFATGSVGRALPGLTVEAVDEAGQVLPAGEAGELRIQGPSLMLAYLDDPEGTARVLSRLGLLSGDRGRVDAAGYVYVEGRLDGICKVAGERVSAEEVAAVLQSQAGLREVCVIAVPDPALGAKLVAFVVGEPDSDGVAIARRAARDRLSAAKRPQHIHALEALPRSDHGKIDLAALRRLAEGDEP